MQNQNSNDTLNNLLPDKPKAEEESEACAPEGAAALPDPIDGLFAQLADNELDSIRRIYGERSKQYGDTWGEARFVMMEAVIDRIQSQGSIHTPGHYRAIALAAFVDMKYWRNMGDYKEDNIHDGVAYSAALAGSVRANDNADKALSLNNA